jgi:riboflavin kinase/FMN adenylyltransferase
MRLYRSLAALRGRGKSPCRVAAIGAFDGLHLGHQQILTLMQREAAAHGCRSVVCSFEPMPTEFFAVDDPPPRLTCFRERFELLEAMGVDELFCPSFGAIRGWTPDVFVEELLVEALHVEHLVVGHDFRFGAGRAGTLEYLNRVGPRYGFDVTTVAPVFRDGERVSSTAIRDALRRGDLARARGMLGRDYAMSGRVVHGLGLGKDLGFPTANVNLKRRLAPVDGIFAVRVEGLGPELLDGVASVGNRPMIGGGKTLLEVYLFDFDRPIYGEYITVRFIRRLREERTFSDLAAMQEQMHRDVRDARAALGGAMAYTGAPKG